MATRINNLRQDVVALVDDEVSALATLLYSLDKENKDILLPPNYKALLLKVRKELFLN